MQVDAEKIVHFMKRCGVVEYSTPELTIKLHPSTITANAVTNREEDLTALLRDPLSNPASEDELLFWSSGGAGITDPDGNLMGPPLTGEDRG